jgi:small-conductance mechanosensitive channel
MNVQIREIIDTLSRVRIFNISLADYTVIFLFVGVSVFVLNLLKGLLIKYLSKLQKPDKFNIIDIVIDILSLFTWSLYVVISLNLTLLFLANQDIRVPDIVSFGVFLVTTVYLAIITKKVISLSVQSIIQTRTFEGQNPQFDSSGLRFLEFGISIIVWVVAFLFVLQNRNVNINALVGGLGVAGIAFAFALQNLMGDLFASISIYTDKPFTIGDFIKVGDDIGEVVKIGLKTTRIKTLQGEELVISNKEISNTKIKNLTRVTKRKVLMDVKFVKSEVEPDLEQIPKQLKKLIDDMPKVKFYATYLKESTEKYFIFVLEFDVGKVGYKDFLAIQNTISVDMIKLFGDENVEFSIV